MDPMPGTVVMSDTARPHGMRQTRRRAAWLAALSLAAAGCETTGGQQEQTGRVIGGVIGGVVGSQIGDGRGRTAATLLGTLAGAVIGGAIGRAMDETDRRRTAQALESAPSGQTTTWRNPDTGAEYKLTPTRTFNGAQGPCRDYRLDGRIDGRSETLTSTACRQPDGHWRVTG